MKDIYNDHADFNDDHNMEVSFLYRKVQVMGAEQERLNKELTKTKADLRTVWAERDAEVRHLYDKIRDLTLERQGLNNEKENLRILLEQRDAEVANLQAFKDLPHALPLLKRAVLILNEFLKEEDDETI